MKITMGKIAADGTPGPRWHVTTSWQSGKLTYIGHLHEAVNRGEEISFEMVREWPAKCHPLMREGEAEDFLLRATHRLQVRSAEYRVILPPGYDAVRELVGAQVTNAHLSVATETDQENRKVYVWRSSAVPTTAWVGMRLQLK